MASLNRRQSLRRSMVGELIAPASRLKYILWLYYALEDWPREKLLAQPSLAVDEISLRVERSKQWTHVYAGRDLTGKLRPRKGGQETIETIHIIPPYGWHDDSRLLLFPLLLRSR